MLELDFGMHDVELDNDAMGDKVCCIGGKICAVVVAGSRLLNVI